MGTAQARASSLEYRVARQKKKKDIVIVVGHEFNHRHRWLTGQIKGLTKSRPNNTPVCSWLHGMTIGRVGFVDSDMAMFVVHIGDKKLAIVDDTSRAVLEQLKTQGYDAIALATNGRADPEDPTGKKRVPGDDRNHIEEALISLIDSDQTPFIDPDFRNR